MASILSNTAVASIGRGLNIALSLIATGLITRYLGVGQYGNYALILSFGALVVVLADFGLYLVLTRDLAHSPQDSQKLYEHVVSFRIILSVAALCVGLVGIALVPHYRALTIAFGVVAAGLMFQGISQLLMGVYQTHKVIWKATIGDIVGRVVQVLGVSLFPFLSARGATISPLVYMTLMFTLGVMGAFLIHSVLVPVISPLRIRPSLAAWKKIARTAWPLGLMLILQAMYFRADMIMLSWFLESRDVGIYGLSYRIIEALLFIPAMFGGLLLPQLSVQYQKQNTSQLALYVKQAVHVMVVVGLGIFLGLILYADDIVVLLSGQEFAYSAVSLRILAVALLLMFVGNVFGYALIAFHKQRQLLILYAVLVVLNIIANAIYIPLYGVIAAAWTTATTELLSVTAGAYLVRRVISLRMNIPATLKLAVTAVGTLLISTTLPDSLPFVVHVGISASVFVLIGSFVRVVRLSDVRLLTHP